MFLGTERTSIKIGHVSNVNRKDLIVGVELTLLWEANEVQLLALLGARDMPRKERVHKSLKVRSPPLRKCVADFPVIVNTFAGELRSHRCEALIQSFLETFNFIVLVVQIITGPENLLAVDL